jgi:hypothetical protein
MTTTTATRVDLWTLITMREAKAVRVAHPEDCIDPAFERFLDEAHAAAEAAYAAGRVDVEAPVADEPNTRPTGGNGASTYGARNAATDKQVWLIAKLAGQLGVEVEQPRDKAHASQIIDRLKTTQATAPAAARPARPATERQVSYLMDLVATRSTEGVEVPEDLATLTFDAASTLIGELSSRPRATHATPAHGIREGRYAFQPAEGPAQFYRVSRTGRIKVQAGPEEHPYNGELNEGLTWIAANQRDAAALYGQLIGACGRCGRALTDEESRALGLGPICADKF